MSSDIRGRHCNIDKYFTEIFSCATLGKGKDKPALFLDVCNYYGVNVIDAWVFEDSLVALESAKKAGLKTVGIYDQYCNQQDAVEAASTVYVGENETMMKLTEK